MASYETVIGLEVHVELLTKSKIFCACPTDFGGDPNTHCCPVCCGMPGTLPVLNRSVVEYAMRAGITTECRITPVTVFDRKNYMYPDLPKAYQISQLYHPICTEGRVAIRAKGGTSDIRIREIHLEEDAGKLVHDPWEDATLADYNRCGVPLIEIVTQPDFRSADEVLEFLAKLRMLLRTIGVSDCKMQEGSMRTDLNISVRKTGTQELGTRTEMKNMNSFKAIRRAVDAEAKRQIELLEEGKKILQETRRWDENRDASFAMRSKENAQDYRYFPDPDLVPVVIDDAWLQRIRDTMPERPEQKAQRYADFGLSDYEISQIIDSMAFSKLLDETVLLGAPPKEVCNFILGPISAKLNQTGNSPDDLPVTAAGLASLIRLLSQNRINRTVAAQILEAMYDEGADPEQYMLTHKLEMVSDDDGLRETVIKVLAEHADTVEQYRSGNRKVFGFLVGQCMRALRGKADPAAVNRIVQELCNGEK